MNIQWKRILDSIAVRISVSITLVVATTTIAVAWLILREEKRVLELELQRKGTYLAEVVAQQMIEPLLYEEKYVLYSILQSSMTVEEGIVVFAGVYDDKGRSIVSLESEENKTGYTKNSFNKIQSLMVKEVPALQLYDISFPIIAKGLGTIGYLRLGVTKKFMIKTLEDVKRKLYLLSSLIIFSGIMAGLWMARKILGPILVLHKGVRRVGEGEVGVEVPVVGEGEIKELALSFNKMSVKLKELIDAIKAAQENLIRTEKLYAIGEFSAGVAHEIKNPLTSIKMLMQTVKHKNRALSAKDIEIIEGEINRIDHFIKEFLAFARPEKVEKTDVNLNGVLEEVITITKPKMEQSSINLVQSFSSSLPMIKGSHDALKQAFLNLVLNAVQAMDGRGGTLGIETSVDGETLSVVIKDTGVGIPGKDINRIFDPFFTTKEDGTGMGLALTHNIINDHSGKIDIDSTPGIGTTVKVAFPL